MHCALSITNYLVGVLYLYIYQNGFLSYIVQTPENILYHMKPSVFQLVHCLRKEEKKKKNSVD